MRLAFSKPNNIRAYYTTIISRLALVFCLIIIFASISIFLPNIAFADTLTPTKEAEIKFDSKRRFTCGGYSLGGPVPELDGDTEVYKEDTETHVCTFAMGVGKCPDGTYCKCPPAEWDVNNCWLTYGKHRQKQFDYWESKRAKPSPEATPPK